MADEVRDRSQKQIGTVAEPIDNIQARLERLWGALREALVDLEV